MRVSNVGRLNYRPVKMQDRPEGGFSDLVELELEKICSGRLSEEMTTREGETIWLYYGYGSEGYDPEHTMIIKCSAWGKLSTQTNSFPSGFRIALSRWMWSWYTLIYLH